MLLTDHGDPLDIVKTDFKMLTEACLHALVHFRLESAERVGGNVMHKLMEAFSQAEQLQKARPTYVSRDTPNNTV